MKKGLLRIILAAFILVIIVASFTVTTATLFTVCPERACDFDNVPFMVKILFVILVFVGTITFAFSCWLLTIWFRRNNYIFNNDWYPWDFVCWGWPVFVFSLILLVIPWLIALGFYTRGLPLNFWAAFFVSLFLHLNASGVVQILFKPSLEDVHLK